MTVRPSCHNVRKLRHMRKLVTSVYPFTLFINCFVQLCRSVNNSSLHNERQFVTSFRSVRT